MNRRSAIAFMAFSVVGFASDLSAQGFGRFEGEFDFRWLPDGRNMRLLGALRYIDQEGQIWDVPAGAETDGASIPRVFWSLAGPFEGAHRNGAVVHDWYCQTQSRTWRATHLVFYNAMRAAGVGDNMAKVLFGAVYFFGPRWGIGSASKGPGALRNLSPDQEKQFVQDLESWIDKTNPTLDSLTAELDNPQFVPSAR